MSANEIGFGVLGPLQMTVDGAQVTLGTPKQRAVLAMLVMNRNRPVSTDSLITAAWEECPPAEATGQPALLHLESPQATQRRGRRSEVGVGQRAAGIPAQRRRHRLRHRPIRRREGRGCARRRGRAIRGSQQHLTDALAEWRGPVLDDLRNFQFVDAFATAFTEDKVVAHTARAEAEIACGRGYAVIGELETLTVEYPYREPLWAQLITAYYAGERQSEALDAYQRLKSTLADDLGIDPGPTVRALHERILRQESLDVKKAARTTAVHHVNDIEMRTSVNASAALATLRSSSGRAYPLTATATRIGRLSDNDIVLDDSNVSRHHAVVIDTGTSFVITDLRSANGVVRAGSADSGHRDLGRRRPDPHLRPRFHVRDRAAPGVARH